MTIDVEQERIYVEQIKRPRAIPTGGIGSTVINIRPIIGRRCFPKEGEYGFWFDVIVPGIKSFRINPDMEARARYVDHCLVHINCAVDWSRMPSKSNFWRNFVYLEIGNCLIDAPKIISNEEGADIVETLILNGLFRECAERRMITKYLLGSYDIFIADLCSVKAVDGDAILDERGWTRELNFDEKYYEKRKIYRAEFLRALYEALKKSFETELRRRVGNIIECRHRRH